MATVGSSGLFFYVFFNELRATVGSSGLSFWPSVNKLRATLEYSGLLFGLPDFPGTKRHIHMLLAKTFPNSSLERQVAQRSHPGGAKLLLGSGRGSRSFPRAPAMASAASKAFKRARVDLLAEHLPFARVEGAELRAPGQPMAYSFGLLCLSNWLLLDLSFWLLCLSDGLCWGRVACRCLSTFFE